MEIQQVPHDLPEVQLTDSHRSGASHMHHAGPGEANAKHEHEEQRESDSATADLHLWWREGSQGGHTNAYLHVAVLLIRWREDLDELCCADEVERLAKLFRESFKYETDIVELHDGTNVDLQLCGHIAGFVEKHDRPGSLLIVYYSGHGSHVMDSGHLALHPQSGLPNNLRITQSNHLVRAIWQDAEQHLIKHANCDILAILDCCFAGNVHKGGFSDPERTYQLLSAGDKDQITQRPGELSFTTALIKSLSELLKRRNGRPFTTTQLRDHIASQESRKENPPRLTHRLYTDDRLIFLGPLQKQKRRASQIIGEPSRAFLTVRLALSQGTLNQTQVQKLAQNMTQAAKLADANVQRLDLLNFSVSTRKRTLLQMVRRSAIPAVRLKLGGLRRSDATSGASDTGRPSIITSSEVEIPMEDTRRVGHLDTVDPEVGQHPLWHNANKRKRPPTPESNRTSLGGFPEG